jgi:hypothetical protein
MKLSDKLKLTGMVVSIAGAIGYFLSDGPKVVSVDSGATIEDIRDVSDSGLEDIVRSKKGLPSIVIGGDEVEENEVQDLISFVEESNQYDAQVSEKIEEVIRDIIGKKEVCVGVRNYIVPGRGIVDGNLQEGNYVLKISGFNDTVGKRVFNFHVPLNGGEDVLRDEYGNSQIFDCEVGTLYSMIMDSLDKNGLKNTGFLYSIKWKVEDTDDLINRMAQIDSSRANEILLYIKHDNEVEEILNEGSVTRYFLPSKYVDMFYDNVETRLEQLRELDSNGANSQFLKEEANRLKLQIDDFIGGLYQKDIRGEVPIYLNQIDTFIQSL